MPRLRTSEDEIQRRKIRAIIAKGQVLRGLTDEEMGVVIGTVKRTFQNKRKYPETFTLEELWRLDKKLKFTDEEKITILCG